MSEFWIQTYTGKKFDLLCPSIDMICIEDIAHHLSHENRYNGACKFPYSVGYHSICVSNFAPEELKLAALLHDAEEAYYKDLTEPWKRLIRRDLNTNLFDLTVYWTRNIIARKFDCETTDKEYSIIKEIDLRMAKTEVMQIMADAPENWHPKIWEAEPYNVSIMQLQPENVEKLFLAEFEKLRRDK